MPERMRGRRDRRPRPPADDVARRDEDTNTTRIEAFSDGVFAIAITLLVLEIRVPPAPEGVAGAAGAVRLTAALRQLWPSYLGFVMSFTTIGIMWANHHNIFKLVRRSDPAFVGLNTLLLLCVSFLPFPTGVLAEYLRVPAERTTAALVYGGTLTVTAVVFNALWLYASRWGDLLGADVDAHKVRTITRRFMPGAPLYLAATLLSLWSVTASLVVHGLLAALYVLPERRVGRRRWA